MTRFRIGLTLLWLRRFYESARCLMTSREDLQKASVFMFVNGSSIQTPTKNGLIGDKFEYWLLEAENSGIVVSLLMNPFTSIPLKKTRRTSILIEFCLFWPVKIKSNRKSLRKLFMDGELEFSYRNRIAYRIYFSVLSKYQPKMILGIGLPPLACLAASHLGIRTAEFQHGIGFREEFDIQRRELFAPNLFLMWHDVYSQAVLGYGQSATTIGYPHNPSLYKKNGISTSKRISNANLIFSASYLVNDSADQFGFIHKVIQDAINILKPLVSEITLRLHPAIEADLGMIPWRKFQYEEIKSTLLNQFPGINLEFSSEYPLMHSLARHDLHISYNSSVIFEAGILGIPSILLTSNFPKLLVPDEMSTKNLVCYSSIEELPTYVPKMLLNAEVGISNHLQSSVIQRLIYDWS